MKPMGIVGRLVRTAGHLLRGLFVMVLAVTITVLVFLLLPVMQRIAQPPDDTLEVRSLDTASLEPPPPPPVQEEPEQQEEEPPPPELADEAPPLDLSQLELALNPGFGDGIGGDFEVRLLTTAAGKGSDDSDAIFSLADLDQSPRVIYQPAPTYPSQLKKRKLKGTVHVLFVVTRDGRVARPMIQKSTHAAFNQPALHAVKRWRFEPGKSGGKAVQFKMKVPITFLPS